MHGRPRLGAVLGGLGAVALLSGCATPISVSAGPSSTDPVCAGVLVQLPENLAGLRRQEVTSQATAAWLADGAEPATAIALRCGVEPPGPTTDPCTVVSGVDWVVDESNGTVRYRTYGRVPAVAVDVPTGGQDGVDAVLSAASKAVADLPAERQCL